LAKLACHFIQIIRDRHNLSVGDTDKLVGIGRVWIASRLLVDLMGESTIEVDDGADAHRIISFTWPDLLLS
jgi:hypothetical protein